MTKVISRETFGTTLNELGLLGLGAEIGVAYGHNSKFILDLWKGAGMFLIDPYDRSKCGKYVDGSSLIQFDACRDYMMKELASHFLRCINLRMTSNEAVSLIADNSLDFVYVDGNHHQPQIGEDLVNWWPKIKPGGIFGGHDYYDLNTPAFICDVKSAVDAFVTTVPHTDFYDTPTCSSWWIHK